MNRKIRQDVEDVLKRRKKYPLPKPHVFDPELLEYLCSDFCTDLENPEEDPEENKEDVEKCKEEPTIQYPYSVPLQYVGTFIGSGE